MGDAKSSRGAKPGKYGNSGLTFETAILHQFFESRDLFMDTEYIFSCYKHVLHSHQKLSCLKSGVSYSSTVSLPLNQE